MTLTIGLFFNGKLFYFKSTVTIHFRRLYRGIQHYILKTLYLLPVVYQRIINKLNSPFVCISQKGKKGLIMNETEEPRKDRRNKSCLFQKGMLL